MPKKSAVAASAWNNVEAFRLFSDREYLTLSVPEQIALHLADKITEDLLPAGEHIIEQELAESFKVSRGPVREAIRILEREGLVTIQPRRGAIVRMLTPQDLKELDQLQRGLVLMGLAWIDAQPDKLGLLREGLDLLEAEHARGNLLRFIHLSNEMVRQVGGLAGNRHLYHMLYSITLQTLRYQRQVVKSEGERQACLDFWRQSLSPAKV